MDYLQLAKPGFCHTEKIGRCSVDTFTQVQNVVHKILNFKPEDLDYKYDMFTLATSEDFYSIQSNVLMEIDEMTPYYSYKSLKLDPGFSYLYTPIIF